MEVLTGWTQDNADGINVGMRRKRNAHWLLDGVENPLLSTNMTSVEKESLTCWMAITTVYCGDEK